MTSRTASGATLALIAACALIIILTAAAFFLVSTILGGGRELQAATNSGTLNVAKQVVLKPDVPLNVNDFALALQGNLNKPDDFDSNIGEPGRVNLLTYNRLIGQALLVALNAEAEGNPLGITNARKLIAEIQTDGQTSDGQTSIGSRLKNALLADNWAQQYFSNTGMPNSLRMLGSESSMRYANTDFACSYLEQIASDTGATNISLSGILTQTPLLDGDNVLPYNDYEQFTKIAPPSNWSTTDRETTYMRGYQPIKIGSVGTIYGVPVQPGHQPHLVSHGLFSNLLQQPGNGSVALPPNGFRSGALAHEQRSHADVHMAATAIVGTPHNPFPIAIPNGYLVFNNAGGPGGNVGTFTLPNTDNVAASELFTGINVDRTTGYFSNNGTLEAWQNADRSKPNWQKNLSTNGLFDNQGNPVSKTDAAKIPSTGAATICNDKNSYVGGDPQCNALANNPVGTDGLDAFNKAYHPNGLINPGRASAQDLTAAEQTQCQIMNDYGPQPHGGGPPVAFNHSFGPTGLRFYPNGRPPNTAYPWSPPNAGFIGQLGGCTPGVDPGCANNWSDPNNTCRVTQDGNIVQLCEQTRRGYGTTIKRFITQRLLEIKPTASKNEIDLILSKRLQLGKTYVAFMSQDNGKLQIVEANAVPPWLATLQAHNRNRTPDGNIHGPGGDLPATKYNITRSIANPQYSYGIHDVLFTQMGNNPNIFDNGFGEIQAEDSATFMPASGAFGLLGVITLQERTYASANLGFNGRD